MPRAGSCIGWRCNEVIEEIKVQQKPKRTKPRDAQPTSPSPAPPPVIAEAARVNFPPRLEIPMDSKVPTFYVEYMMPKGKR